MNGPGDRMTARFVINAGKALIAYVLVVNALHMLGVL